jgi:hypothetical protein
VHFITSDVDVIEIDEEAFFDLKSSLVGDEKLDDIGDGDSDDWDGDEDDKLCNDF